MFVWRTDNKAFGDGAKITGVVICERLAWDAHPLAASVVLKQRVEWRAHQQ